MLVGLQPTVIASRASPPLLEQSSSIRRIVDARRPSIPCAHGPSRAASSMLPLGVREANERTICWIFHCLTLRCRAARCARGCRFAAACQASKTAFCLHYARYSDQSPSRAALPCLSDVVRTFHSTQIDLKSREGARGVQYHARMARRAQHFRCYVREANERTTGWITRGHQRYLAWRCGPFNDH